MSVKTILKTTVTGVISLSSLLTLAAAAEKKPEVAAEERKETWPEKESFEKGLPAYITATDSELSLIHEHVQDGKTALRWDYKNKSSLTFKTGLLGNVNVYTGYGNYSRSTFTLRVYLPKISQGKLIVEFLAGDKVAGHYEIPMQHKGWQQIVHHYTWHSKIKWTQGNLRKNLDNIRIRTEIPKAEKGADYAIFDAIQYNTPRDFRDARNPVTTQWNPLSPDFSKGLQPKASDLKKLSKLEELMSGKSNPGIKDEVWVKKIAHHQKRIDTEGLKPGNPINKNLGHYFGIMNGIASDYVLCANPVYKQQIADQFLAINSWMQDQGLVVNGATGVANNYIGRTYVDAIFKMRQVLIKSGQMEVSLNFIKWSYHYDSTFFPGEKANYNKSMDYFYNEAWRLLSVALMHSDPATRWHHVTRFQKNYTKQLIATIKPDGSLFHHGMHYFAYAGGAMNSVSGTTATLTSAGFPVSEDALDAAKLGIMKMRWYAGGKNILLSLCGRHPSGKQNIPTGAYLNLAKAYAPYRDGKWDKELVSAYLRFTPKEASKPEFSDYKEESSPHGYVTMPYAGLGLQRRDNWLAGVKGFSSFVASSESYANANRFGLYLSNGSLELLTHPKEMPTVLGSGIHPDEGYNWLALAGTTSIHSSLKHIANGNGSFHEKSGGHFNGGLSHNGQNGVFAQVIKSGQANKSREKGVKGDHFKALKTWFFFDNRIICLGSDISVDHVDFPVRTTLFQKFLTDTFTTTSANKENLTLGEKTVVRNYKDGVSTLTDPYGNSYITAKGNPVHLTIGEQKSRNGYDNADTTGNYATAWIDHGKNPTAASYEYAILVQDTPEATTQFAQSMAKADTAPYHVLKQDVTAHILYDRATNSTAYVIFDSKAKLPTDTGSPLLSAAQPCIVMVEEKDDRYIVSLTNPNPRDNETEALPISITFKGAIQPLADFPKGSSHAVNTDFSTPEMPVTTTSIMVPITNGESYTFSLKKS